MEFLNWGEIPYQNCEEKQLHILSEIAHNQKNDTIIFCTHPAVVTLGRATKDNDLTGWRGETYHVQRGGRATYHGPDQLVVYFLMNLEKPSFSKKTKDVVGLLRFIESSTISLLNSYSLDARGKTIEGNGLDLNDTGVWVGPRKIASVGIAVRKWISFHGIALNLDQSAEAFQGIQPCGFQTSVMTSLEKELGRKVSRQDVILKWTEILKNSQRA